MKKLAATLSILLMGIFLLTALLMVPGFSHAQMHSGGQGQHKTKSSMTQSNMGIMADISAEMYQLMSKEQLKPEQEKQILGMMNHLSRIMMEMSVPYGEQVKMRHNEELKEMLKRMDRLYERVGH
jgi:hypothetical protein